MMEQLGEGAAPAFQCFRAHSARYGVFDFGSLDSQTLDSQTCFDPLLDSHCNFKNSFLRGAKFLTPCF